MAVSANPTPICRGIRRILLNTAGSIQYSVKTEIPDEVIFSGKAVNRPGETSVEVELFDILAPHLTQNIPDIYGCYWDDIAQIRASNFARRFILSYGSTTENIDVRADYDERSLHGTWDLDTEPVRLELPYRAPLVASVHYCPVGAVQMQKESGGGGATIRTLNNTTAGAVTLCFDTYDDIVGGGSEEISIVWPSGTNGGDSRVGPKYKVAPLCGDAYVLYYVNIYGGLDAVWMKGICRRTDTFEREEMDVYRYMASTSGADRRVARIDGGATWELNTGILSDAEADIFARNVPGTPYAFLLRIGPGSRGWPVTIEDAAFQHLDIARNGRRPVNYTLNVKLAQDRVRL